jgi:hypothetical protein
MTTIHRIHPAPRCAAGSISTCATRIQARWSSTSSENSTSPPRPCCADPCRISSTSTPSSTLEVDLSAAPFVDVSAAGLLLNAHRRAEERGATLSLTHCSAQLVRLLHLAHVVELIEAIPAHDE